MTIYQQTVTNPTMNHQKMIIKTMKKIMMKIVQKMNTIMIPKIKKQKIMNKSKNQVKITKIMKIFQKRIMTYK